MKIILSLIILFTIISIINSQITNHCFLEKHIDSEISFEKITITQAFWKVIDEFQQHLNYICVFWKQPDEIIDCKIKSNEKILLSWKREFINYDPFYTQFHNVPSGNLKYCL